MLGKILDVGAEGSVQGGDVGAVGTVDHKDMEDFGAVKQMPWWLQAASGTAGFDQGKILFLLSVVSHQSSVQVWK